ncbi:MAG: tetratricopeptide repeat protein [Bacteroidia bacterium]
MRYISFLTFSLLFAFSIPAQAQKVIKKIAGQTCDCLTEFKMERDEDIIQEVIGRCVNAAVENNIKALVKTFGSVIAEGDQDAIAEIGQLVNKDLRSNCPAFITLQSRMEGTEKSAQEWFDEGENYLAEGELRKAEGAYTKAMNMSSGSVIVFNNRGHVRRLLGDYYGAIADFKRAIELADDDYAIGYLNLANTKNTIGDETSALADIERSIELDPTDGVAYQVKGHILSDLEEYEEAATSYREGFKVDPENLYAFYNLGRLFLTQDMYDSALVSFNTAVQMGGTDDEDIYNYRGLTFARLDEHRKAIDDFNKAIAIEDEDPAHYFNRAISYKGLGMYDSAYKDFSYTIEIEEDAPENYQERGDLLMDMNKVNEALTDYTKALEIAPLRASAMDSRAAAKAELGDYAGALEDYNSSLELYPNDESILFERALIKSELGDEEGSCEDLKRASGLGEKAAKSELEKRDCGC